MVQTLLLGQLRMTHVSPSPKLVLNSVSSHCISPDKTCYTLGPDSPNYLSTQDLKIDLSTSKAFYNLRMCMYGGGGGGVSNEICGTVRLPV